MAKQKKIKLSLACGDRKPKGFIGIDLIKTKDTDIIGDILDFGKNSVWKQFTDNSVHEIECHNFVEHIPQTGNFKNDLFFKFFDEIYRVLKPAEYDINNPNSVKGGFANIICPYYTSRRAFQDPTHCRFISEGSFIYLNKEWRKQEKLDHYPVKCDFDFFYKLLTTPELSNRNHEVQSFQTAHYWNVISDISVTLVKKT